MRGKAWVGTSGWRYPPWRGVFYPKGLPQRRELEYISRQVGSVEINGSFYSLQRPESYRRWHDETPDDFVFAVKGGRFITHMKRLRGVEDGLANFFGSGVHELAAKLGPVLWQLPPTLAFDADLLTGFFDLLPRRSGDRPLRHALEVRHPSFTDAAVPDLLREHDIALVVADAAATWPYLEEVTSDFVYVRLTSPPRAPHTTARRAGTGPTTRIRSWRSRPAGRPETRCVRWTVVELTELERQVLHLISHGTQNGEIADRLAHISMGTVRCHVVNMRAALISLGWTTPDPTHERA